MFVVLANIFLIVKISTTNASLVISPTQRYVGKFYSSSRKLDTIAESKNINGFPCIQMFRERPSNPSKNDPKPINFEKGMGNGMVNTNNIRNKDVTKIGTLTVPTVGIGSISWSTDSLTTLENLELQSLVSTACQYNAAFFDTAERYGGNWKTAFGLGWGETEMLTRKLLDRVACTGGPSGESAKNAVIATKFTPSPWRTNAKSVVDACEQSRLRLGVDKIDLYQLHMPDIVQPLRLFGINKSKDESYWDGIAECYHKGLISNVGVSNYGPTLVETCQEALAKRGVPLASNQIAYSLIGRHDGAQETVDKCHELGVKVLGCYPLGMGLLTGKYSVSSDNTRSGRPMTMSEDSITSLTQSKKTKLELNDLKRYAYGEDGNNSNGIPKGGILPLVKKLEEIAVEREKTVAQVALNYVICKGVIPIPGARTSAQVEDNIGAMGWRLSDDERDELEEIADGLEFGFDGAGFKRTSEKFVGYGVEKWKLE